MSDARREVALSGTVAVSVAELARVFASICTLETGSRKMAVGLPEHGHKALSLDLACEPAIVVAGA